MRAHIPYPFQAQGARALPGGHVLVGQARGHVEHDDRALAVDVVAVAQAAELLLARRVPAVEADLAAVGGEVQRAHLHADRGLVLLLELARQVALHERGLACVCGGGKGVRGGGEVTALFVCLCRQSVCPAQQDARVCVCMQQQEEKVTHRAWWCGVCRRA